MCSTKATCHYRLVERHSCQAEAFFVTRPKDQHGPDACKAERQYRPLARRRLHRDSPTRRSRWRAKATPSCRSRCAASKSVREEDGKTICRHHQRQGSDPLPKSRRPTKFRWQIELLFRWLKQHLKLRKFLGDQPKRRQTANPRGDDRLYPVAAGGQGRQNQTRPPALQRTRRRLPLRSPPPRRHPRTRPRPIPAENGTKPIPISWLSAMRETSPDSRALVGEGQGGGSRPSLAAQSRRPEERAFRTGVGVSGASAP